MRIGEEIRLGGGEVNSRAVLDESVQKALPEQCSGPYWVASLEVGPVMTAQDSTTTPVMIQKLRITNQSSFSIQNLVVRFPEDRVEFGDVLPGETTDFRVVPFGVYRYAAYDFEVEGQEYQQPVVDWVGESPMNGVAFTYILDVDPSTWETEGQVIWLVDVIGGQDNITPSLTPSVRMSEKEAIDKAIALATSNQPEINATGANLTNIKAQQSTIADAFQEILSTSTLPPGYTPTDPVWIVTMDGEWSAGFPLPTHISTPEAYRHFYVILDAKSGSRISLGTYR